MLSIVGIYRKRKKKKEAREKGKIFIQA